ncbi:DUF6763 family protein [Pleionea mediterranea]|jgi:hypothetical protein|uniref:Uncharacterized protein n=1 Tax=Pleionea mediterranea TaxID=523701 RepID=A0A316FMW3_9GAMM|nr:DUF6763 family protein [Pleionea mediterranea]PWK50074.1 hypothetical protein C8D97_107241 [Pleionea mediterranea]
MNNAEIGHWYRINFAADPVEVIALDDNEQVVEFQHFEGEIESLDLTDWQSLTPREVEAPEDWSGPYEMEWQDINPESVFMDYTLEEAVMKIQK